MVSTKKVPQRRCIGCGEFFSKKELIRVIRTAEGAIELDATGRKNGRGAYLCRKPECLKKAIRNRGLEHSLKTAVPADVYEILEEEMKNLGES